MKRGGWMMAAVGSAWAVLFGIGQPTVEPQPKTAAPVPAPKLLAIHAVVSIPPLKGLVEPLLPEGSTIDVLIPPGVSEHGHEISPSKMAALAMADLVVYVGFGLEPQVERFLQEHPLPTRRVVRCTDVARDVFPDGRSPRSSTDEPAPHRDAESHGHRHEGIDPHVWLDPVRMKLLVFLISSAILDRAPELRADEKYMESLKFQGERVKAVDDRYGSALTGTRRTIIVAHDAYSWLAKRYNLDVVAIAGLNAAEPTPSAIAAAAKAVKEKGVKVIFVEPQLSQAAAKRIADATGARVMVLDPLGDGDWFKLMEKNLEALKAALTDDSAPDPKP